MPYASLVQSLALVFAAVLLASAFAPAGTVQRVPDLAYESDGADAHRLDLYLPTDREHAPLVVFVHGGAFLQGDRRDAAAVGEALAREGLATAVVSYRLFPDANAEGATQDVAMAAAWIIRHASGYGIQPHGIFLVGHSAGAQIAALIGTDGSYLARAGLSLPAVRGVFAVSGAYDLRDLSGEPDSWQRVDGHIYGETAQARARVSPSLHVDAGSPPAEVACGTDDDPGSCPRALFFEQALRRAGIASRVIREVGADHAGMLRALIDPNDPLNKELLHFIRSSEAQ